jgi:hypothetical protein
MFKEEAVPESDLYSFSHKELITELIKASGVHEGRWMLALQISIAQGAFGSPGAPGPPASVVEANPGVLVTINKIGIQRVPEGTPGGRTAIDAAEVNPATVKGEPKKETPHLGE